MERKIAHYLGVIPITLLLLGCIWTLLYVALKERVVVEQIEVIEQVVVNCSDGHSQRMDLALVDQIIAMFRVDGTLAAEIAGAVHAAGRINHIDVQLILAVIKVESDGRPRVRSKSGALGLMQILPSTGKELAAELGEEWTGNEMLFEVDTNIRYGTRYLRHLFNRFDSMQEAIAAYNWGPGHIAGRIRRQEVLPREYPIKVMAALPTGKEG